MIRTTHVGIFTEEWDFKVLFQYHDPEIQTRKHFFTVEMLRSECAEYSRGQNSMWKAAE